MENNIARLQNQFITNEYEKSNSWKNNAKFLKNQSKSTTPNNPNLKSLSSKIEQNCENLGKLISAELERRQNEQTNQKHFVCPFFKLNSH